ncbi:hypothetical protein E2562_009340 [Oryza meyeriana var. granulata]|uniref:Uncharacterized protein n=1 Tax=Oryza meyeriana var. granulata TaxID=110450 RepID=A0A6G1CG49_9ORYZ|nr:hypothetical protein E2562_009340 [Oryza meyeriana var. granulata]
MRTADATMRDARRHGHGCCARRRTTRTRCDCDLRDYADTSRDPNELAIVVVEEPAYIIPEDQDEGLSNDNEIASEIGVEPSFPVKRRALRKKHFDENNSEEALLEGEKQFKIHQ